MSFADLSRLQVYIVVFVFFTLIMVLWVMPALVATLTPLRYRDIVRELRTPLITGFAAGSSLVVLPMLAEACKRLIAVHLAESTASARSAEKSSVDVLIPTFYSFPTVGNVLSLGFVVFSGWYIGTPLSPTDLYALLSGGAREPFRGNDDRDSLFPRPREFAVGAVQRLCLDRLHRQSIVDDDVRYALRNDRPDRNVRGAGADGFQATQDPDDGCRGGRSVRGGAARRAAALQPCPRRPVYRGSGAEIIAAPVAFTAQRGSHRSAVRIAGWRLDSADLCRDRSIGHPESLLPIRQLPTHVLQFSRRPGRLRRRDGLQVRGAPQPCPGIPAAGAAWRWPRAPDLWLL